MSIQKDKDELYTKEQLRLAIHDFQISDIYIRISDIYVQIRDLDKKIDTKFMWFYAVMIIPATLSILHSIGWV